MESEAQDYIKIKIDSTSPIPAKDLARAIEAISNLYTQRSKVLEAGEDHQICVKRVQDGSIELFFIILESLNTGIKIYKLGKFLKDITKKTRNILKRRREEKARKNDSEIRALAKIATGNDNEDLTFVLYQNGQDKASFRISSETASEIIEKTNQLEIEKSEEELDDIYRRMTFYWHQARADTSGVGDMGIIANIASKPLKVTFINDDIKTKMTKGSIFENRYLVDVNVHTIDSVVRRYEIVKLHAIINESGIQSELDLVS